jgi:hypothetical protein
MFLNDRNVFYEALADLGHRASGPELRDARRARLGQFRARASLLDHENLSHDDDLRAPSDRNNAPSPPPEAGHSRPLLARVVADDDAHHRQGLDLSSPAVLAALRSNLGAMETERLLLVHLDRAGRYLTDETVAIGKADIVWGSYRTLIERAFHYESDVMIIAHNHPSGNHLPSDLDLDFTRAFRALTRALNIKLHDHLVVTRKAVFSIRQARPL